MKQLKSRSENCLSESAQEPCRCRSGKCKMKITLMWWLTFSKILQIQLMWQHNASQVREGVKFLYVFFYTYAPLCRGEVSYCPSGCLLRFSSLFCPQLRVLWFAFSVLICVLAKTMAEIPKSCKDQTNWAQLKRLVDMCRSLKNFSEVKHTNVFRLNLSSLCSQGQ